MSEISCRTPKVRRVGDGPLIAPHMDDRMGDNINGPSLIRVPGWVTDPLGKYYLYFAHHNGTYIRLAYADKVTGPWKVHEEGVLPLEVSGYLGHIASPDVHVDEEARQIRLYFHGSDTATAGGGMQTTRLAVSRDGLEFEANTETLGGPYFRMFRYQGWWYALVMPGQLLRSRDGITSFEQGPRLFTPHMRHSAVLLDGHDLHVFFSNIGDCPERILHSRIRLGPDWNAWRSSEPVTVLEPELDYEGGHLPNVSSLLGRARQPVRQLRDPAIFCDEGRIYLLYSIAGEAGIALAECIKEHDT
jgi:hypothetical protein